MVKQDSSVLIENVKTDSKSLASQEKMTKKKISLLLKKWTDILGLEKWKINLVYEDCEDESSYMEIIRSIDYHRAKLIVPTWVIGKKEAPKDLIMGSNLNETFWEESLVHELLHLVVTPMSVVIRQDIAYQLHRDVFSLLEKTSMHAEERVVDNLSVALVKAFREK
jgi:hypothetical protein